MVGVRLEVLRTIAHPVIVRSDSPSVIALLWGLLASAPEYAARVPPGRHARFMAVVWAHLASFGVGLLGTLVIAVRTQRRRYGSSSAPG